MKIMLKKNCRVFILSGVLVLVWLMSAWIEINQGKEVAVEQNKTQQDYAPRASRKVLPDDVKLAHSQDAFAQIKAVYPQFDPDPNYFYVNEKIFDPEEWYCYAFSKVDKGFGYEVYHTKDGYKVNFDKELYEARIRLITKLNELRPENDVLNSYIGFTPYGVRYIMLKQSGIGDGHLEYAVALPYFNITNIDSELAKDYQMLVLVDQIIKKMGKGVPGVSIKYYQGVPDFKLIDKTSGIYYSTPNRHKIINYLDLPVKDSMRYPSSLKLVASYSVVNKGPFNNSPQLEEFFNTLLASEADYIYYAKMQLRDKDRRLLFPPKE